MPLTRRFCLTLLLAASLPAAEPADWIVTAGRVVTMDGARRVLAPGAIAVRNGRIVAIGEPLKISRDYTARNRLLRPLSVLTPGLISTHTHAPMSLLRGIADDLNLQEWLEKFIFPAEAKNVGRDFVRWGTLLACLEMMLAGTTTYADMYYFEEVIAAATKEAGMRGVLGQTIIGFPAPDYKTPQAALAGTEKFLARFRGDPLITPAVAPHAIYTNSAETLRAARALANRYEAPLLIHVSETKKENDDSRAQHGMSPTAYLDSLGVLESRTLAAHCVHTDAADWATLARRGTGVAHCPSSNMKLASGAAPVVRMLDAGIAVGLGPDGPAGSNNDFNMFEEMDLAAKLAKVTSGDPRALPASTAFSMATRLGARALGMENDIGSLEPGKRADLIVVNLTAPHAVPAGDIYSLLVYALKGSDVSDVMINGRWTVRSRRPLTLDIATIRAKAVEFRARVDSSVERR